MGTRSLTHVMDDDGKFIITMYRQHDGYPSVHGQELFEFLKPFTIIHGLSGQEQKMGTHANGVKCLAAQLVGEFKKALGGIYLYPAGSEGHGEEYTYTVSCDSDSQLNLEVRGGQIILFKGLVANWDLPAIERADESS